MLKFLMAATFAYSIIFSALAADIDKEINAPSKASVSTITPSMSVDDIKEGNQPQRKKKKKKKIISEAEVEKENISPSLNGLTDEINPDTPNLTPSPSVDNDLIEEINADTPNLVSSPSRDSTPRREETDEVHIHVDTDDIEAARCTGACLKGTRGFWAVTSGWFRLINTFAAAAKPIVTTLATFSRFSEQTRQDLGITSTILNGVSLGAGMLADAGEKNALKTQAELATLQTKIDGLIRKAHQHDDKLKAASITPLTEEEDRKYRKLRTKVADLTTLSRGEKCYFRFVNCFWTSTSGVSDVVGLICKAGALVMVPLTTIPKWDSNTDNVLNIVAVSLEAGSLFCHILSQNAKKIGKDRERVKEQLEAIHEKLRERLESANVSA